MLQTKKTANAKDPGKACARQFGAAAGVGSGRQRQVQGGVGRVAGALLVDTVRSSDFTPADGGELRAEFVACGDSHFLERLP